MKHLRFLLSVLVTWIVTFNLGGLWNQLLMFDFYSNNSPSIARPHDDPKIIFIMVSYLAMAIFMAILFRRVFENKPDIFRSFSVGAIFGFAMSAHLYLILYSVWEFKIEFLLVDVGWHIIEQGLGGVVMGLILIKKIKTQLI